MEALFFSLYLKQYKLGIGNHVEREPSARQGLFCSFREGPEGRRVSVMLTMLFLFYTL